MLQELQLNVYIQLRAEKLSTTKLTGSLRVKVIAVGHKLGIQVVAPKGAVLFC